MIKIKLYSGDPGKSVKQSKKLTIKKQSQNPPLSPEERKAREEEVRKSRHMSGIISEKEPFRLTKSLPQQAPSSSEDMRKCLENYSLNREAFRLLKQEGCGGPQTGRFALGEACIEAFSRGWYPDTGNTLTLLRLNGLIDATNPEQFTYALQPFLAPLWLIDEILNTGDRLPYSPETLEEYTPSHIRELAKEAETCEQLMDALERGLEESEATL